MIIKKGLSTEEAFRLEKLHIKMWGREIDGGVLLNENLGGEGKPGGQKTIGFTGRKHTEETKKKISAKTKGENNPRWGVKLSPELKERMGAPKKEMFRGAGNPNSKIFKFFNKEGEEFIISGGFKCFCEEHEISFATMRARVDNGRVGLARNGWGVIPIT